MERIVDEAQWGKKNEEKFLHFPVEALLELKMCKGKVKPTSNKEFL